MPRLALTILRFTLELAFVWNDYLYIKLLRYHIFYLRICVVLLLFLD